MKNRSQVECDLSLCFEWMKTIVSVAMPHNKKQKGVWNSYLKTGVSCEALQTPFLLNDLLVTPDAVTV